MTNEIKINKANKSITFINNGIAYSQFGIADEILDLITNLQKENKRLNNIIKKALNIIDSYNLGKYDYSIPPGGIIELKDVLEEKRRKNDRGI